MTEKEAEKQAQLNNRERLGKFCPTIRGECQKRCICFVRSEAYEGVGGEPSERWRATPTGCLHKDHQFPDRDVYKIPCTFPPHPVVKKD